MVRRHLTLLMLPAVFSSCGLLNTGLLNTVQGCRSDFKRPDIAALANDLANARLRWQAAGIKDYSYEYVENGFIPFAFPKRVTVVGGIVKTTEWVNPKPGYPPLQLSKTIDERFNEIAAQITTIRSAHCYELSMTFDPTDGHPLKVFGGTAGTASAELADGFGGVTFSNFTRL